MFNLYLGGEVALKKSFLFNQVKFKNIIQEKMLTLQIKIESLRLKQEFIGQGKAMFERV